MARYPRSLNPVLLNDIFFSVHAMIATTITITQCFFYDRGDQRVSITARGIVVAFGIFLLVAMILCFADVLIWLDFLYYCSYVKLGITLIKYVPQVRNYSNLPEQFLISTFQAYMNYKRKSTIGWSIGNIFLDFTGGTLSMLQMIVNSYNYGNIFEMQKFKFDIIEIFFFQTIGCPYLEIRPNLVQGCFRLYSTFSSLFNIMFCTDIQIMKKTNFQVLSGKRKVIFLYLYYYNYLYIAQNFYESMTLINL